jgi:tetratricopeptide (TPR) repeat protein
MKRILVILMVLSVVNTAFCAQNAHKAEPIENYVFKADGFIQKSEYDNAVSCLEDALALYPKSDQVKSKLAKTLTEWANKWYVQKEYDRALGLLNRAKSLAPYDKSIKEMHVFVQKAKQEKDNPVPEQPNQEEPPVQPEKSKPVISKPAERPAHTIEDARRNISVIEMFQKSQKNIYEYKNSIDELKEILPALERKTRMYLYLSIGSMLVALTCLILYLIGRYRSSKREHVLMQHKDRLISMIEHQDLSFARSISRFMLDHAFHEEKIGSGELIVHSNPHIRAKGIELLEEELVLQNDPVAAIKVLVPFLRDPNNRVKGNAVKAVFRYNRDLAMKSLVDMVSGTDKWMQLSAVWAIAELGDPAAIDIMLDKIDYWDHDAQARALRPLHKLIEKPNIQKDVIEKIRTKIKQLDAKGIKHTPNLNEILSDIPGTITVDMTDPNNQQAILRLSNGIQLYKDGKYNESIWELKDSLTFNKNIWQTYEYLGNCYYNKGKSREATRCYERVLVLNPSQTRVREMIEPQPDKPREEGQ